MTLTRRVLFGAVLAAVVLVAAMVGQAAGKPFLHPLFADNAVLQRGVPVPVWGWTTPGARVVVSMAGKRGTAVAGDDGKWVARVGPFRAGGPYKLTVSGPKEATARNVLVGDVWVCSGQSNMEMGIGACNVPDDIAKATYPKIRLMMVPHKIAAEPVRI